MENIILFGVIECIESSDAVFVFISFAQPC